MLLGMFAVACLGISDPYLWPRSTVRPLTRATSPMSRMAPRRKASFAIPLGPVGLPRMSTDPFSASCLKSGSTTPIQARRPNIIRPTDANAAKATRRSRPFEANERRGGTVPAFR